MKPAYTIVEGYISVNNEQCFIPFALVYLQDGVYYVDTFLSNKELFKRNKNLNYYRLVGKTEKGYDIEIEGLFCRLYKYENCKAEFVCDAFIKLIDNKRTDSSEDEEKQFSDKIYLVEFEGLKMHFAHHTFIEKYRKGEKVDEFFNSNFDHTSCALIINHPEFMGNYYHLVFTDDKRTGNVIIDFTQDKGYNRMEYQNYLRIRNDLLGVLSFLNGGHVDIKRELTGSYMRVSDSQISDAQIVYIYSKKERKERFFDDFIPVNDNHSYSSDIVPHMFIECFDKYFHLNKQLDFNSLVFSLNNSTETVGLEEKYFILITALERICNNYVKISGQTAGTLIDTNYFRNVLKFDLNNVLEAHKSYIKQNSTKAWDIFKSKIGDLNRSNSAGTSQKMYEFLSYASILINDEVTSLIEVERNQAVHEGVIGGNEAERIKNYWKLDHILRDIILNLIGYKSYRNHTYKYFQ